jgi:hypothetical protein
MVDMRFLECLRTVIHHRRNDDETMSKECPLLKASWITVENWLAQQDIELASPEYDWVDGHPKFRSTP